jgi:hypothetical protein
MAYGFGATKGTGASDRLVTSVAPIATSRTIVIVCKRNGAGGSNFGRYWDSAAAGGVDQLFHDNANSRTLYQRTFSGASPAQWSFPAIPADGNWHILGFSYNPASTSNVPTAYIDGTAQTVTTITAASGTVTALTQAYWIGNRPTDSARVWDGEHAEFGIWDSILSSTDHSNLAAYWTPLSVGTVGTYARLKSNANATVGTNLTVSGALVTTHPANYSTRPLESAITGPGAAIVSDAARSGSAPTHLLSGGPTGLSSVLSGSATLTYGTHHKSISGSLIGQTSAIAGTLLHSPLVKSNAIWTWYNDTRAVSYNGNTYVGWVNSSGDAGITKRNESTGASSSYTLRSALTVDDHCNVAVVVRPDGKLFVSYFANPTSFIYTRVSTNAEDISAWGSEVQVSSLTGSLVYSNPRYLSGPDKMFLFSRDIVDTNTRRHIYAVSSNQGTSWSTMKSFFYDDSGHKPYAISTTYGSDEIHWVITNMHPAQGQSSVYHFYAKWSSVDGDLRFYKSDGTQITAALPFGTSSCTLVYDGSTTRGWDWDIKLDSSGKPRILFSKYPGNTGSVGQIMHTVWNGSAWTTPVQVGSDDSSLYAGEPFYIGGACYDSKNVNRVYISNKVSGIREIQEWDVSSTPAKVRDITVGTPSGRINARPYSPVNRSDNLSVIWWSGTYTTWANYSTSLFGVSSSFNTRDLSGTLAGPGTTLSGESARAGAPPNHALSGSLGNSTSTISGTTSRSSGPVVHILTGVISGLSSISGTTLVKKTHTMTSILSAGSASIYSRLVHTGPGAVISNAAGRKNTILIAIGV